MAALVAFMPLQAVAPPPLLMTNGFGDLSVRRAKELGITARELQVMWLLRRGYSSKEVADKLGIKIATVNGYVRDLYIRLGLQDRFALGVWIAEHFPVSDPIPPLENNHNN